MKNPANTTHFLLTGRLFSFLANLPPGRSQECLLFTPVSFRDAKRKKERRREREKEEEEEEEAGPSVQLMESVTLEECQMQ